MSATPISRYEGQVSGGVQVRLTADRVRRWEFGTASFTRRGYDHTDVDRFRVQVADELDVLATQIANLRAENERLNGHVELHRHGVIPSAEAVVPAAREVNLLSAAQREAEQIVAQAHDYARRIAEYARMQYESYMRAAAAQARQEAERVMAEYRGNAGVTVDGSVAAREALRMFGEMMMSHMRAAARHLDDGSEQLARTMQRLAQEATPVGAGTSAGAGQPLVALPRHQH